MGIRSHQLVKSKGRSVSQDMAKRQPDESDALHSPENNHRGSAMAELQRKIDASPLSGDYGRDPVPVHLKRSRLQNPAIVQRVLIVGSYNEKRDINDMGLWWAMACEHLNAKAMGFEAVILTLKDFNRDYDQEYTMSVKDKIRFITHGNPGGTKITNETEPGKAKGRWTQYQNADLQDDDWAEIEHRILTQIEVFNHEQGQIATGTLLKPYFCFMMANQDMIQRYHPDMDDIGDGEAFLTNNYILALDPKKMQTDVHVAMGEEVEATPALLEIFEPPNYWKSYDDVKGKLPLLKAFKEGEDVDMDAVYAEIFAYIEPKYQLLVGLVEKYGMAAGKISEQSPWDNIRTKVSSALSDKQVVSE